MARLGRERGGTSARRATGPAAAARAALPASAVSAASAGAGATAGRLARRRDLGSSARAWLLGGRRGRLGLGCGGRCLGRRLRRGRLRRGDRSALRGHGSAAAGARLGSGAGAGFGASVGAATRRRSACAADADRLGRLRRQRLRRAGHAQPLPDPIRCRLLRPVRRHELALGHADSAARCSRACRRAGPGGCDRSACGSTLRDRRSARLGLGVRRAAPAPGRRGCGCGCAGCWAP